MNITNPTKDDISIVIKGTKYTICAGCTIKNVPEKDAKEWKNIHQFIILSENAIKDTEETSTNGGVIFDNFSINEPQVKLVDEPIVTEECKIEDETELPVEVKTNYTEVKKPKKVTKKSK